ncbi:hypothetical protein K1719_021357 [Acacia pycnantha]|nr:hypothetical protein K1719_021357 [Acacia pycnantha]
MLLHHDGGQATWMWYKSNSPHHLQIKTLKRLWQTAYDIIYGPNTSGFGWDPETKLVTADDDVWDEYLKTLKPSEHSGNTPTGGRGGRLKDTTNDPNAYDEYAEAAKWKREVEAKEPQRSKRVARRSKQTPVIGKRKNPSDDHAHSCPTLLQRKKQSQRIIERGRAKWLMLVPVGKTKSGKPQTPIQIPVVRKQTSNTSDSNGKQGRKSQQKEASPAPALHSVHLQEILHLRKELREVGAMFANIVDEKLGLLKADLHSTLNEMESRLRAMALDLKDVRDFIYIYATEFKTFSASRATKHDMAGPSSNPWDESSKSKEKSPPTDDHDHETGGDSKDEHGEGHNEGDGENNDEADDDSKTEEGGEEEGDGGSDDEEEDHDEGEEDNSTPEEGEKEGDGVSDDEPKDDRRVEEEGDQVGDSVNDSEHEGGEEEGDDEHEGGNDSKPEDEGEEEGDDEHEGRDHSSRNEEPTKGRDGDEVKGNDVCGGTAPDAQVDEEFNDVYSMSPCVTIFYVYFMSDIRFMPILFG